MGIFNNIVDDSHPDLPHTSRRSQRQGPMGPPGVGYKLTNDKNYDIDNKKLTNVAEGIDDSDVLTKHQVEIGLNTKVDKTELSGIQPEANKIVKYLPDKGLLTHKLYIEDDFNDSVIIKSENQDYDNINLKISNLSNFDGSNGRRVSEFQITSLDQTISGKKIFQQPIQTQNAVQGKRSQDFRCASHARRKHYN